MNRLRAWNETKPWMMGIENGETRISFFFFAFRVMEEVRRIETRWKWKCIKSQFRPMIGTVDERL